MTICSTSSTANNNCIEGAIYGNNDVNPTRMVDKAEKTAYNRRAGTQDAKDKRDELMRQFDLVRENRELRKRLKRSFECNAHFVNASAVMSAALDASLMSPKQQGQLKSIAQHYERRNACFTAGTRTTTSDIFPYGSFTSLSLTMR